MKKNTLKIINLVVFSILCVFILKTNSLAIETTESTEVIKVASAVINTENYKPKKVGEAENAEELAKIGNTVVGVLQIVGSIISVIVLAIIGIKYMLGSVEERAEYKKTMIPYLIGAVMVFGISNLLVILIGIVNDLIG